MNTEFYSMEQILCDYLSGCGTVFLPETWRDGAVCVSLTAEQEVYRTYVDGSYLAGIPFEVRIRCSKCADHPAEKMEAAAFFAALADYIYGTPMPVDGWHVVPASGKPFGGGYVKSAVYDDGTEEYRAAYLLKFYITKQEEVWHSSTGPNESII